MRNFSSAVLQMLYRVLPRLELLCTLPFRLLVRKEIDILLFLAHGLLSFLCKDREEKFKDKPYNDKDKFMSTKHNICG